MTPARRRALSILANAPGHRGRRSNDSSEVLRYVYWQSADWLCDVDYAVLEQGREYVKLTAAGVERAAELGLIAAATS